MIEAKKQSLSETFSVYLDRRMFRILLLGAISGFPWVLIGSSLSLWLKEEGLSRSTIGWAGLIFAVYAFNYLWAPLVDRLQIPYLTKKLGHRRGWIVLMQIAILTCLVTWSFINPTENLALLITVGLIIAIASATQDITVDALRIEQIGEHESKSMAAGAAMAVVGWWSGYKLGGVIALFTAQYFENIGLANYWQITFLILGVVIILMNIGLMFVHEPILTNRLSKQNKNDQMILKKIGSSGELGALQIIGLIFLIYFVAYFPLYHLGINLNFWLIEEKAGYLLIFFAIFGCLLLNIKNKFGTDSIGWLSGTFGGPVTNFFKKNGFSIAIGILGFVFLFKIGEAFLGRMSIVFYKEIGFSKSEIAIFSKAFGWITTVVFTLLGGILAMRAGSIKTMFVAGILMAVTNLLFAFLNWYTQTIPLVIYEFDLNFILWTWHIETSNHQLVFGVSVISDDIAAAFATVAFVAFISLLVDRTYTATQYALLASIGTAGRTTLASSSGALVDWLNGDWGVFFILTAIMVIPSLICLWFIKDKLKLREK